MITDRYVSSLSGTFGYAASTNPATPCSLSVAFTGGVAGDRFNIINDAPYPVGVTTVAVTGTALSPVVFRGYQQTPGDGYQGRINGNGPLITNHMPIFALGVGGRISSFVQSTFFDSLYITGNASNQGLVVAINFIVNCFVAQTGTTFLAATSALSTASTIDNCDISMYGQGPYTVVNISSAGERFVGNRIIVQNSTGATALTCGATTVIIKNTLISNGSGIGMVIPNTTTSIFDGNTINGFGNGMVVGSPTSVCITNNIITNCSEYGIVFSQNSGAVFIGYNYLNNNASGNYSGAYDWITGSNYGTISGNGSNDYVNPPFDLRLLGTSPAVGMGFPPSASIGAYQYPAATGSSEVSYSFV